MKKILLIEDNDQMRENLQIMLEMEGYSVSTATNGRIGVSAARNAPPDVILCDVMMPELDGLGVLKELRADAATDSIPFIFLTARGEKSDLRAGMNLGADDYLVKPVGKEDVLAAIQSRLQRQHQTAERVKSQVTFAPDFSSPEPLRALGLSPREAEVLLWISQGKNNEEIGLILGMARNTVKKHVLHMLDKLGVDSRNAAALRAIELLSAPKLKS
jgi:DNA-binding NarL/FixJ family response regulator